MTGSVGSKVTKGAAWMVASQTVDSVVGAISTIILARLLLPEDFGLTALAWSLVALLALLRSFSFDLVLIQRQNATREDYDTAFTFSVLFSVFLALLLGLAAGPFARIYGDMRLVPIVWLIALSTFIEGIQNIGIVDFRKDLLFHREFVFVLVRRLGSFVITVALAFTFHNYWALVLGSLAGQTLATVLSYVLHPFRPRFMTRSWRAIFGFSKWNAINAAANATSLRAGDFLIGKLSGPAALGLFELSNDVAFLTSSALGAPINRAVYPGYARTAQDHESLRATFQLVIALIAILIMPAGVGLASISDSLVPIVLGPKWLAAIPLVAVLAFRGLIHALVSNVPYVYLALGKPKLATYALVARAVLLLPMLWFGLRGWGVMGAACAFTASMALEIPIHLFIVRRELQIRVASVLDSLWRPTVAAGLMALAVRFLSVSWLTPEGRAASILRLVALVGIGAVTYTAAIMGLWQLRGRPKGAERAVFDAVGARFAAWSGRQAAS